MRVNTPRRFHLFVASSLAVVVVLASAPASAHADPAPPVPAGSGQSTSTSPLTAGEASTQAKATGHAVAVDGATTLTDTVAANPNGTFTLTRSMMPVRKLVNHTWQPLNPTLHAVSGGVSPTVTTEDLVLSGGGSGPLATMRAGDRSLALSLPMSLPAPTLSGATATYPAVLPGVDLQITATSLGGFSEVFVVHNAAAAANPLLKTLTMATTTTALTLAADSDGNLAAKDASGQVVFAGSSPIAWDSTPATSSSAGVTDPRTGATIDPGTGMPLASSPAGPGQAAHIAHIGVSATASQLTLTPPASLLTAADTTWPVYLDPPWSVGKSAWASVAEYHPTSNYWNTTPDPQGKMQVGNSGSMWSHTLVNFGLSGLPASSIQSAQFNLTETWSYSCTASTVNVYAPSPGWPSPTRPGTRGPGSTSARRSPRPPSRTATTLPARPPGSDSMSEPPSRTQSTPAPPPRHSC